MNICYVSGFANRAGGADVYTEALAIGLTERGHNVTVICHDATERCKRFCHTIIAPQSQYHLWPGLWRVSPAFQWAYWRSIVRNAAITLPDVIICSIATCMPALAGRFPGIPLIYLPHARIAPLEITATLYDSAPSIRKIATWVGYRAELWCLRHSSVTVRFTQEAARELATYYGLSERRRFKIIPSSVNGPVSAVARQSTSPVRLLHLGRLIEWKNAHCAIEQLARLSNEAWTLDIVGDGPERADLERRVAKYGLQDRIHFHGHQTDVARFYSAADLMVFPSRLENFPLVILEAMSYALPTLGFENDGVTYRNSNAAVITHGHDGLLARGEEDFHDLLLDVIRRPAQLTELGNNARQTFGEKFSWSKVLEQWENLFDEVSHKDSAKTLPAESITTAATK